MNQDQKIPQEVESRIHIRNEYADALTSPSGDIEKADFLLQLLQDEYTCDLPTERVLERWRYEHSTICFLIDIARDYVLNVQKGLNEICETLKQENERDGMGGGNHKMAYEMLDSDLSVATCAVADMPEWILKSFQNGELIDITFFYEREMDLVVVNVEHFHYDVYAKLVLVYLELDAADRKELRESKGMDPVLGACDTLDYIIEAREEYKRCRNLHTTS